jgi:hypothetical protein
MLWRPFSDVILWLSVIPTNEVQFLRPSLCRFGKNANGFFNLKFDINHDYASSIILKTLITEMPGAGDRTADVERQAGHVRANPMCSQCFIALMTPLTQNNLYEYTP